MVDEEYLVLKTPHPSAFGCHLPPLGKAFDTRHVLVVVLYTSIDNCSALCYNVFENQSAAMLYLNKHFVEIYLKSDILKSQKRF